MMKYLKRTLMYVFIASISTSYAQDEYFVTTWNTQAGGETDNTTIMLPIFGGAYDVDVNNNGHFDDAEDMTNLEGIQIIDFGGAGTKTIRVRPNPDHNPNNQLRISHYDEVTGEYTGTRQKLTSIDKWGDIVWTSMENAFEGCSNMTLADNAGVPDLSMVTSMRNTFLSAESFNGNLSSWNVSNVTSMWFTFWGARSFNGNLSNWNVSNVTSMVAMFSNRTTAYGFNGNISTWNVSNVTDMNYMFWGNTSFNGNISNWNVSNVTDMNHMFWGNTNFNGNISNWNVSNVTDMDSMLEDATSFNGNISTWNVSNVRDMRDAFQGATSFNGNISTWNVSNVTSMNSTFSGATSFSSENYDALLTEWAKLSLQQRVTFGAPPTTYCAGKAGRDILTGTYNWDIQGDNGEDCTAVTSVDDEFLSNTKIYPNPANGNINIESPFTIEKLELYNILGAKLFSISKTNTLNLTNLSQGIYILKVFSADRVINKKIIKNNN